MPILHEARKESAEELYRRIDALNGLLADSNINDDAKAKLSQFKKQIEKDIEEQHGGALRITPVQGVDDIYRAMENGAEWRNKRFWKKFAAYFKRQNDPEEARKHYLKRIKKLKAEGRNLVKKAKDGDELAKEQAQALAIKLKDMMKQWDPKNFMKYLRAKKGNKIDEPVIDPIIEKTMNNFHTKYILGIR